MVREMLLALYSRGGVPKSVNGVPRSVSHAKATSSYVYFYDAFSFLWRREEKLEVFQKVTCPLSLHQKYREGDWEG